jgi:mono/diheme cytochrome c family protein
VSKIAWCGLGALAVLLVQAVAVFLLLARAHGWSAREQPVRVETWVARRARAAALPAKAREQVNPVPNTPEVLTEARAHWADHCASCHANDGSGDSLMGKRMYPPAPDMRRPATQNLSDGELFFIIQNGVRLTGMPAWGGSGHDAEDSWKLVRFIRHLPALTLEERRQMEKLNPKGPDDRKEEEEEEKFLKGEDTHVPAEHHHHH